MIFKINFYSLLPFEFKFILLFKMHLLLHEELKKQYGAEGYLIKALKDVHEHRENSPATAIVSNHIPPLEKIGGNHAYTTISGLISDAYASIRDTISGVAQRLVIQAGEIPDGLDTLVSYLDNIKYEVRRKLEKTIRWIGARLGTFWNYLSSLLSAEKKAWLWSILESLKFDWVTSALTKAATYAFREIAAGLRIVFETLRDLFYSCIETMSSIFGSVMEVVVDTKFFAKARRSVIRAICFYTSCNSDFARYAVAPKATLATYMENYRLELAKTAKGVMTDVREELKTGESKVEFELALRSNWIYTSYQTMFTSVESIVNWLLNFFSWFYSSLRRLASAARTAFQSTLLYGSVFGKVMAADLQQMAKYAEATAEAVPLRQSVAYSDRLLKIAKDARVSKEKIDSLQRAIDIATVVIDDPYITNNNRIINFRDGLGSKEQFEMNHLVAELLEQLVSGEMIDNAKMQKIYEFYTGSDIEKIYIQRREALATLEAQYATVLFDIIPSPVTMSNISGKAGKKEDVKGKEEEEEEEESEKKEPISSLQQKLRDADTDLDAALAALEKFELTATSSIQRDETYLARANKMAEYLEDAAKTREGTPYELLKSDIYVEMSLMVSDTPNVPGQQKHLNMFQDVFEKFNARNKLAKRLGERLRPVIETRNRYRPFFAIVSAALPLVGLAAISYYATPVVAFSAKETKLSAFWRSIPWIGRATSTTSIYGALSYQTWLNIFQSFQDVNLAKVPQLPVLFELFSVVITAIPVTIAFSVFAYYSAALLVTLIIDAHNDVAVATTQTDERGVSVINFEKYSSYGFFTWLVQVGKGLGVAVGYLFERAITLWIALLVGKFDQIKEAFAAAPTLLSAADPIGSVFGAVSNTLPSEQKFRKWLQDLRLLPSQQIWEGVSLELPVLEAPIVYRKISQVLEVLPPDHELKTGRKALEYFRNVQQERFRALEEARSLPALEASDDTSTTMVEIDF